MKTIIKEIYPAWLKVTDIIKINGKIYTITEIKC